MSDELIRLADTVEVSDHFAGGKHITAWFDNGYGFSAFQNWASFEHIEVAVMHRNVAGVEALCYSTPLTHDVERFDDAVDAAMFVQRIKALPESPLCDHVHKYEDD
jgi:hypothetical protein